MYIVTMFVHIANLSQIKTNSLDSPNKSITRRIHKLDRIIKRIFTYTNVPNIVLDGLSDPGFTAGHSKYHPRSLNHPSHERDFISNTTNEDNTTQLSKSKQKQHPTVHTGTSNRQTQLARESRHQLIVEQLTT